MRVHRDLAYAYFGMDDWENATRILEEVLKKLESTDPGIGDPWIGFWLAILNAKQDRRIEGIHWYSRAVLWTREWESDDKRRNRLEFQREKLDSLQTEAAGLLRITEQKPEPKPEIQDSVEGNRKNENDREPEN